MKTLVVNVNENKVLLIIDEIVSVELIKKDIFVRIRTKNGRFAQVYCNSEEECEREFCRIERAINDY